jgi:Tfp pilus assembly protein PilO
MPPAPPSRPTERPAKESTLDADELKARWKALPIWGRLAIALVLGLLPAGYTYYNEAEGLEATLAAAKQELETSKQTFETKSRMKGDLPKEEERLAFTEEQLTKAKRSLPDSFRIEDVLQKTAAIAKEVGVKYVSIVPQDEQQKGTDYKYMELPIQMRIDGKFGQVVSFFDRIVHLESAVYLSNIEIGNKGDGNRDSAEAAEPLSDFERAKAARAAVTVQSTFTLLVYRSLSAGEGGGKSPPGVPAAGAPPPPGAPAQGAPPPAAGGGHE